MKLKKVNLKGKMKFTKKKAIILAIIVVCVAGGATYVVQAREKANAAAAEPMYETATVEKKDLTKEVSVNGTIASANKKTVQTEVSDVEVQTVNVKVGDVVKAGDVLCTLDSTTIDSKLTAAQQEASIGSQKASQSVSDAQINYNDAVQTRDSDSAKKSQAVTDSYNALQASIGERDGFNIAYQQAQSDTATAKSNYETLASNPSSDAASVAAAKVTYESAITAEATAKDNASAAQAKVDSCQADYNTRVQDQDDTNRANTKSVALQDSALDSAKLDQQASKSGDTAQGIADLQKQKDACTVVAPCDGTITAISVEAGDTYKGGELMTIQDTANLQVSATVDQYTISEIENGMNVIIKTDTTGDLEMPGTLSFVSPVPKSDIDANGKTTVTTDYEIKADFVEQNEKLRLGMSAKTTIIIDEAKDVLSVPASCIQTDGEKSYVTVLVDETTGETKDVDVTVGLQTDYDAQISGNDIKEGMQVIIPDTAAMDTEDAGGIYQ